MAYMIPYGIVGGCMRGIHRQASNVLLLVRRVRSETERTRFAGPLGKGKPLPVSRLVLSLFPFPFHGGRLFLWALYFAYVSLLPPSPLFSLASSSSFTSSQ